MMSLLGRRVLYLDGRTPRSGLWPARAWVRATYFCNRSRAAATAGRSGTGLARGRRGGWMRARASEQGGLRSAVSCAAPLGQWPAFVLLLPPRGSLSAGALGPFSARRNNPHGQRACRCSVATDSRWRSERVEPESRLAHPRNPHLEQPSPINALVRSGPSA